MFKYLLLCGIVVAVSSQKVEPISENVIEESGGLIKTLTNALKVDPSEGRTIPIIGDDGQECTGGGGDQGIGGMLTKIMRLIMGVTGSKKDSIKDSTSGVDVGDPTGLVPSLPSFSGIATLSGVVGTGVAIALGIAAALIGFLPGIARSDPALRSDQYLYHDEYDRNQHQEFHNTHKKAQEHYDYYSQS